MVLKSKVKISLLTSLVFLLVLVFSGTYNATPAKASQSITTCGSLNTSDMIYVLQNDVSSAGTCFIINANNISLDLGGHNVTYGTSLQNAASEYDLAGIKSYQYNRQNI